ncbi:MAG TPA: aminodeoxychorismate synthase component I [Rhizomicrobium sp.]|jgi:para-aminobenzoate synthetase/4-amino-4-deoxychorismate lyase|nr:aminodeoxychorismate synthase component I [Rhizomicrobium sp.]
MRDPIVLVDDTRAEPPSALCFARPRSVITAKRPEDIEAAFRGLEEALSLGSHVAGYFGYDLGYFLEPRLAPPAPRASPRPLLWLGVFDAAETLVGEQSGRFAQRNSACRAYAGPLQHEWSEAEYIARFHRVHALIGAGEIYQANLSFRSQFAFVGDPLALYRLLRESAAAAHCAYIDDGERQILSLSPELFFALSADRRIVAKPMKGTAARHENASLDAAARVHLRASNKERAENLMIVDLVRNDLGRIAELGSVSVEELFAIETYPTVHQMVSTVTATLRPEAGVRDIVRALFPCGSVTGAPKIRAMEIIRELESSPRGLYCGAIGYFAPDGSAKFNVAIRTLTISGSRGELGVGGAVVHDSQAHSEYAECLLKARYFGAARAPIELIETLRWSPGEGFVRLDRHLARMASSAATFGIQFDRDGAVASLPNAINAHSDPMRFRLALAEDGTFSCVATPLSPASSRWRFTVSPVRVSSNDALLRHKTSWREMFEQEHSRAVSLGYDEIIFLNERGEITEGSRTNIFVRMHGKLVTPAISCGLLNGCLRQELIDCSECSEAILSSDDLVRADEICLGNSLRGLISADLAGFPG